MTNLPSDITERAKNLIFKFEFGGFDFKNIDGGQPYTLNYEQKKYRQDELVSLLFSALPYFALTEAEYSEFHELKKSPSYYDQTAINRIVKPGKRAGDYGEIILFLLLELFYGSKKLVTKVFYKTSNSLPVFGSDATHFTKEDGKITLWFGESKFYQNFTDALDAAFESIDGFLKTKIKGEVEFLTPSRVEINKNTDKDLRDEVIKLIDGKPSLDDVPIKVPVLITYELAELKNFDDVAGSHFIEKMKAEFESRYQQIQSKNWQKQYKNVTFVFLLLPIQDVSVLKDLIRKKDEGTRI